MAFENSSRTLSMSVCVIRYVLVALAAYMYIPVHAHCIYINSQPPPTALKYTVHVGSEGGGWLLVQEQFRLVRLQKLFQNYKSNIM